MKKRLLVKDISAADREVKDYFLVASKAMPLTKENEKYLAVVLRDRSGSIEGRVWTKTDVERLAGRFEKGDIVYVEAGTSLYQGKVQLKIREMRKDSGTLTLADLSEFYPGSERASADLTEEYRERVGRFIDPHLRAIFAALSARQSFMEKFSFYPASVGVHHVYLGGLLEHSLTVARLADEACLATGGNREIVVAGSLLHDIGKVEEIELRDGFSYSDRGRLLGHITLGVMMLEDLVRQAGDVPALLSDMLSHIIVSHHGLEEWGSPRKPMSIEALIVHYIDNLDAKVMGVKEHMRENMADGLWTDYHRLYESRFFKLPEGPYGSSTDIR
jgi:3'-5' exoribonuclease